MTRYDSQAEERGVTLPEKSLTRGLLVVRHDLTSVFIHESASNMLQENKWLSEPRPSTIPSRSNTNMAKSA